MRFESTPAVSDDRKEKIGIQQGLVELAQSRDISALTAAIKWHFVGYLSSREVPIKRVLSRELSPQGGVIILNDDIVIPRSGPQGLWSLPFLAWSLESVATNMARTAHEGYLFLVKSGKKARVILADSVMVTVVQVADERWKINLKCRISFEVLDDRA